MPKKPTLEEFNKFLREKQKNVYGKIGPTAWTVAYRRTFSDIPYSQQIFDELEKIRIASGDPELPEEFKTPEIAPQFEARYKLANHLLAENKAGQILEIAAGLSPRGLALTDNPEVEFVEVDLSGIMAQKREILSVIQGKNLHANLHLEVGDAFNLASLEAAVSYFKPEKPIAVVNEGLMRYLSFDEKAAYAKNVRVLLKQFGGQWITPDITLKSVMDRENIIAKQQNERIKKITGINLDQNRFENVDKAQDFFENLGFIVERHSFLEVMDELVSPQRLNLPYQEVEKTIKDAYVFVMRAK